MAKPEKNPPESAAAESNLAFEEAMRRLESIVESMEADDLPLETLLQRFEEGTRLARVCQAKLEEAELKIQKLERNAAGETVLKRLDIEDDTPAV